MYDAPLIYDIAFSYRDFRHEMDCLLGWAARAAGGRAPRSFLELAAGPADHAIEAARRGLRAAALDLSPAMCAYARERAARAGVSLEVHEGDMIDLALPDAALPVAPEGGARGFDLAATMISSLAHVPTPAAMVRHLRAVARRLAPGGVYIVEQPHPADFLEGKPRVLTNWTTERDGITVETEWGRDGDPYDPITQTLEATVEMRVRGRHAGEERRVEVVRMKEWTATEMEACLLAAGVLEIAARHGDFALDAPFDSSPASWRMISVLRRPGAA
jgi:SAM-dependent methyltransferase